MQAWLSRFTRLVVITTTSVVAGWLVSLLVDAILQPAPVFEISLKPRHTIRFMLGKLVVDAPDRSVICYDMHDWKEHIISGHFWKPIESAQPRMVFGQKITTPRTESRQYLTPTHETDQRDFTRHVTFDTDSLTFRKFHGYIEADRFDTLHGELYRNYAACVIRRPLLFSSMLNDYFMPFQSPASLITHQSWALQPDHAPCLHSVVSIPHKHVLSQFVLDGMWCQADIAVSPSGKYVVCNRREPSPVTGMMNPLLFMKLWDAKQHRWLSTVPEQLMTAGNQPAALFLRDNLILVPVPYNPVISNGYQLLNPDTGIILDQLNNINADYFIKSLNVTDQHGNLLYLNRTDDPVGFQLSMKKTNEFSSSQELYENFWYSHRHGVLMMQGQQSIIFDSNNMQGIVDRVRRMFSKIPPISVGKPLSGIHDWQTQTTYYPWNRPVHLQRSESGKYLLVIHDYDRKNLNDKHCLAQVFLMPMKLHSPLWGLGAGVVAGLFCLFVLVYLLNRRRIKPNASSSPTVA